MKDKSVRAMFGIILAAIVIFGIILVSVMNQGFAELKNELINNNMAVSNQLAAVNGQSDSMISSIQDMLDKQGSLITGYTITYGKLDAKALACNVTVSVTPKTYSDNTAAKLFIGDMTAPMTRNGNEYTATISYPISESGNASITFEQDGISQNEMLPELVDSGMNLLSSFNVQPTINTAYNFGAIQFDGSIYYSFASGFGDKLVFLRLAAEKDGKKIWSIDNNTPASEQQVPISQTFKTDFEDDMLLYIEATGSSGLKYRRIIFGNKEGATDGIYNSDGSLINGF